MTRYLLFLALLLTTICTYAQQNDGPTAVTPEIEKKINAEIEKALSALMKKYEKANSERTDRFDEGIKFVADTFRIEEFHRKYMQIDYSTVGMNNATYAAAAKYDALLNKYYKLLSARLKPADRATLLAAQRSWIAYRDNEDKLYNMLGQREYSGGGTIQSTIAASRYFEIVKARVLQLFEYYAGLYMYN